MRRHAAVPLRPIAFALMLAAFETSLAHAQGQGHVSFSPATGTYGVGNTPTITAKFCAQPEQNFMSFTVTHNGSDVTGNFTWASGSQAGCAHYSEASGPITIALGTNTVSATFLANFDNGNNYYETNYNWSPSATYTGIAQQAAPTISTTPQNAEHRSLARCVLSCFNVTHSYTTPAYVSLDVPRAVTLLYSSGQLGDLHTVQVNATNAGWSTPTTMAIKLLRPNGSTVTFTGGDTLIYFTGIAYNTAARLAAQFRDSTLATGRYIYTVVVRSTFSGTPYETSAPIPILVHNERHSRYGAGWTVAGVSRVIPGPGDSLITTDGSGTIQYWRRSACIQIANRIDCTYSAPAGEFDSLTSTDNYGLRSFQRRLVGSAVLDYDSLGRLERATDTFNNQTVFSWLDSTRIDSIIDPAGKRIKFHYNASTLRLNWIKDQPGGRQVDISIGASNDLNQIEDPVGGRPFDDPTYVNHRLTRWENRRNNAFQYVYDFAGFLAGDSTPKVSFDSSGTYLTNRRIVTAYRSPLTAALVDTTGSEGTSGNPAAARTSGIDSAWVAPPLGARRVMSLNQRGQVLEVLAPAYEFARYTRNADGQATTALDSTGYWGYAWDGPRLTTIVDSVTGVVTNQTWNATYHRVTARTGTGVRQVTYSYVGTGGRIDSSKVVGELASVYTYDGRGRVVTVTDPSGHVTSYGRDASTFLNLDTVIAGVRRTIRKFDTMGRVVRTIGREGRTDSTVYDALNRVHRVIGALGDTTRYIYGDSVFMTQVIDPVGNTHTFYRNALGWDTALVDPRGNADLYRYTRAGQVMRWTNRRGQQTTFVYDSIGNMDSLTLSDGRKNRFDHSPGRVVSSNAEGSDTLRIENDTTYAVSIRNDSIYVVRTRNERSNRRVYVGIRAGVNGGYAETRYQLDTLGRGRVTEIEPFLAPIDSMQYNVDGSIARIYRGTVIIRNYYRPRHNIARDSLSVTAFQAAFAREFVHDSVGRVVEARDSNRTRFESYAYDANGRLTSWSRNTTSAPCTATDSTSELGALCGTGNGTVTSATYAYDLAGNPANGGDSVATGNRLIRRAGYFFEYDNDGNLTRRYQISDSLAFDQRLYWNSLNQLDSVRTRIASSWGATTVFGYDAMGRRVRKHTSTGVATYYIWSGQQLIAEHDSAYGPSGSARRYSYYPGTDRPHSVVTGGYRRYYMGDARGNVIGAIDSAGANVLVQYRYTPFGDSAQTVGSLGSNLMFAGRERDAETRLYYMRARYYDPMVGRFVSEDLAGLAGGLNRFVYGNNDPVNNFDPSGRGCEERNDGKKLPPGKKEAMERATRKSAALALSDGECEDKDEDGRSDPGDPDDNGGDPFPWDNPGGPGAADPNRRIITIDPNERLKGCPAGRQSLPFPGPGGFGPPPAPGMAPEPYLFLRFDITRQEAADGRFWLLRSFRRNYAGQVYVVTPDRLVIYDVTGFVRCFNGSAQFTVTGES